MEKDRVRPREPQRVMARGVKTTRLSRLLELDQLWIGEVEFSVAINDSIRGEIATQCGQVGCCHLVIIDLYFHAHYFKTALEVL